MNTALHTQPDIQRLYRVGSTPELVDVPELNFLMVDGSGDPNTAPAYQDAVRALYSASYTLRFTFKRSGLDEKVSPLEGLWRIPGGKPMGDDTSDWAWTAMIRQPSAVTPALLEDAVDQIMKLRPLPAASELRLESFAEGQAAQILHTGPYAAEGPTIERLHAFIAAHGLTLRGDHHEIYLSDPRRAAPERLRTIIRQPVAD